MKTYNQFVSHLMSEGILDLFGLGGESDQERWLRTGSFEKSKPKPKPKQSVNLEPYKSGPEGKSGLVNLEPYETKQKQNQKQQRGQGGRALGSTTQRPGGADNPTTTNAPVKTTKPVKTIPVVADRTPAPKPAAKPAAKPFVKQTGDKAKDTATWAKANPTAVASEKKRKASFNPLMDRTFGYQRGGLPLKRSVTSEG